MKEENYSSNIDFSSNKIKSVGYKTLRGAFALFKKINKRYKKMGIKGNFTITLPIKD